MRDCHFSTGKYASCVALGERLLFELFGWHCSICQSLPKKEFRGYLRSILTTGAVKQPIGSDGFGDPSPTDVRLAGALLLNEVNAVSGGEVPGIGRLLRVPTILLRTPLWPPLRTPTDAVAGGVV